MNLETFLEDIQNAGDEDLYILWTNADPVTANLMVFMYAENSCKYKMWQQITIIIWGATVKLVAENMHIQEEIRMLKEMGVHFVACITCAEELGICPVMEKLDIDLIKMLRPLTSLIKNRKNLITI